MKLFRSKEDKAVDSEHKQLLATVKGIIRDNKPEYDRMDRAMKLYEGKLWKLDDEEFIGRDVPHGRSEVVFNTIFANVEQTAPMVTANRPITKVVPRFPFMEKLGNTLNDVLKYAWEACDMQMTSYKAVKDQMIMEPAIFKVGWNPQKRYGGKFEIKLVDPRNFAVAPGYETIWDAPFVFEWNRKPLSWVRQNFPDVKEIEPDEAGEVKAKDIKFGDVGGIESHTKFVTVYEMWTRDDEAYVDVTTKEGEKPRKEKKYPYGKTCYFTEKQILATVKNEDEHGLPPYVELHDYVRPHNFLGLSDVSQIEGMHKEINRILKYYVEFTRKRHDPNYLVDISRLNDQSFTAVKNNLSQGGQYIPWDSQGGNATPPIQQIEDGQFNPEVMRLLTLLMEFIDMVSGVTDVNRGMVGKNERQSASEVAMLKEAGDTRTMQRVRNFEWTIKRVSYLILRLAMQYFKKEEQVSYEEKGKRNYSTYSNTPSFATKVMQPMPMSPQAQYAQDEGIPMSPENQQDKQRYEQEKEDFEKYLEFMEGEGLSPESREDKLLIDFDIEVQADSSLPTDKQSRANLFLRLRQLKAMDVLSLLEKLEIGNAGEIVDRLKEEMGGGGDQIQQMLQQNPALAQKFAQFKQQGGGQ